MIRVGVVSLVIFGGSCLAATGAGAGGSHLTFERESYQPGELAVASGSFGPGCCDRGWIDDGPYDAYLQRFDGTATVGERIPVGQVQLLEQPYVFNGQTSIQRVARVEFVVPELPVGQYALRHCNAGCAKELGDIIGGVLTIAASAPIPLSMRPGFTG